MFNWPNSIFNCPFANFLIVRILGLSVFRFITSIRFSHALDDVFGSDHKKGSKVEKRIGQRTDTQTIFLGIRKKVIFFVNFDFTPGTGKI